MTERKEITPPILEKAFATTKKAFQKIKISPPKPSHLRNAADDFYDMARRYIQDAEHFREKGDIVNAFGALYYAHGWLDAGVRVGFFDVNGDHELFTLLK